MDPEILIYDEPFVGLDPISMGVILRLIRRLNDALGITSIVVSHECRRSPRSPTPYSCCPAARSSQRHPAAAAFGPSEIVRQFMGGLADGPVPFHYPAGDYFAELLARDEARLHDAAGLLEEASVTSPVRPEPICEASRMRWLSPPNSVPSCGRASDIRGRHC